jgi:hypothetical protein
MASVNVRHPRTERRQATVTPILDAHTVVAFEPDLRPSNEARPAAGDSMEGLRAHIAKLELLRRHFQKDIAVKDAYLAVLRADLREKERTIVALSEALTALHAQIAQTLSQPRYRVVDAINRVLRYAPSVHRFLKRRLLEMHATEPLSPNRAQQ